MAQEPQTELTWEQLQQHVADARNASAPQQTSADEPAELSTTNQPPGTTRVENGVAYDISGKPLGQANEGPAAPQVDYLALAKQMGGTPAPPQVDYLALAKQMGGTPSVPATKTAPEQTQDLLTRALAGGARMSQGGGAIPKENAELAQAKNASDYIYNNILRKNDYQHNNLTYSQTPTTAAGKLWQRLWGWATQDEINKIPGLEPDRVTMLRENGNDILGRIFGGERAQQIREHILNGSYVVNVPPEEFARAAAKSLTDFFSPGYYALGAFGKVAQGYQKSAQLAANAGDMTSAARAMGKARLLGLLGAAVNVPFAASQAHDLVENWDSMNIPERIAAVSGILGASLNAHIGIKHMGGYSQAATDAKDVAQNLAQSKVAQATRQAVGSMVTLGKAQTFDEAIQRGSSLTSKKFRQQQANIKNASPELQAVALANPNAETPGQFAQGIRNWLQEREQVLLQASGGTKDSDVPVSPNLENDVRERLDRFFDDNRGKYGNDEQVEAAKQKIIERLLLQSKDPNAPPALRMPNAFETENIRQGLNQEIKPQLGGEPTSNAYRAAVQQTLPILREALDSFYHDKGVKNVKEFRSKEATMIDVADRLEAAEKRAQEMGNPSIWGTLARRFSVPTIITSIALGHNPLAFGALAPYLISERAYHNYKNPGVNIRRAIDLAEPKPITDIEQVPRSPMQGPSAGAPGSVPPGVTPPIHPTKAGQAAAAVAAATMPEPATNHPLNAQLATHFGEPLDHASLDDRIERVKNDAEAMRRSGVDLAKTNTGKMLGMINEHESEHAAKIEAEQQKAHEDAAKVAQELHDEFQRAQEENRKNIVEGGQQPKKAAFVLPYETTDEELPTSKVGGKMYTPFNVRMHELGHQVWSHLMGLQPFDVLSQSHPDAEGSHAVARSDISRLLNPDGTNNKEAFKANLGDLVSRFLAGAVAEDIHGGVPMEQNTSAKSDVNMVTKILDSLDVPETDRKRIIQQAVAQLRETFSRPDVAEIMNAFASKRKAGLSPDYHFDETQIHQLRQALDNLTKGGPYGTDETSPSVNKGARGENAGVGEKPVAGREGRNAPEVGRLNKAPAGLVERSTGDEEADAAIRNGGGVPAGSMNVPGHGDYRMLHDPETGSTLAFKPHETITPQTVGKKLAASRAEFEEGQRREAARQSQSQIKFDVDWLPGGKYVVKNKKGLEISPRYGTRGEAETEASRLEKLSEAARQNQPKKAAEVSTEEEPEMERLRRLGTSTRTPEAVAAEAAEQAKTAYQAKKPEQQLMQPKKDDLSNRLVETFGTTKDPLDAGFILSDGRMVPLHDTHNTMMETLYNKYGDIGVNEAERTHFINSEQAVRTRYRTTKGGPEVVFSVPKQGVTPEQIEQIKKSVGSLRNGNVVMEISEGEGKSAKKEFARVSDVEPMLKEIGALPESIKLQPKKNAPAPAVAEGADEYNEKAGRPAIDATVKSHSPDFAKRVADAFDAMKHEPDNPAVKKSYQAMANEVKKQWDYATKEMGMKFEPWTKEGQPYANSKEMVDDVRNNKHLYFFQGGDIKPESPMAKVDPETGLSYNDMFRAVHDLFGHAAHGFEFGPKGEENAYLVHRQMFPQEAIPALTSETRGQNSWVNFGKHLRNAEGNVAKKGEEGYVLPAQRPYAEQKVGLLPKEFHGVESEPESPKGAKQTEASRLANLIEGRVVGSAASEGGSPKDMDIRIDKDYDRKKVRGILEKEGLTFRGSSLVSPEEAKESGKPYAEGWNRIDHFEDKSGKKVLDVFYDEEGGTEESSKKDWAASVEKAPFGGVNPNNPEAPSKKYGFEFIPEQRHNPDALTAEEARAYANRPEVKAALAAHPDLKLGWDTTTQGPELNIGASTDNLETAKKIAGKLDQRAIVNTQTGEEIPAGGKGEKTSFPEYPLEDRLKDLDAGRMAKSMPKEEHEPIGLHEDDLPRRAKYQDVDFSARDLQDSAPKVTEETIRKDYANGDKNASIYKAYIPMEDLPSSRFVEPEEKHFDREDYRRPRTGVPIKVEVSKDGKMSILDGNHRAKVWEEQDQQYAPAWVVDRRGPNIEQLSEDEKNERLENLDAGKMAKSAPAKEYDENPEGFKHISPQVLQYLEPDEQAFIKGNKRSQQLIQKAYDGIKPTMDETKAAIQAGQALGGWWRRYIDAFNALGEHTNQELASKLGPKHADALKIWHAAVSSNKPVELANKIAWGSYADWLDKGKPRDRASIDRILADNGAITDTHFPKSSKKAGQVKTEGVDTTKLFRLVNSPQMREINPSPFHGGVFDPNNPSPIYGTTSGARKIPSMGATVAGEGNLNRLVLDTHMKDYFGEKKWTDNKYLAFSAHIRQAARELGLQPGEGQEQLWGTVLGIKKLLYEGLPDSEIPDELTNDLIEGIGKDYAQIIKDDPELSDIFERLKAHGIDPGGNRAQERLAAILEGKRSVQKAPVDQARLAESAARIRKNLKDVPEPTNELSFKFGANALKMHKDAPKNFDWEKATPEQAIQRAKDESYANYSLDEIKNGDPWLSEEEKKKGEKPAINADSGSNAGFLHPDGSLSMVGDSYQHDVFSKELGLEDTDAFTKKTGSGTFDIWRAPGLSINKAGLAVTLAGPPTDEQKQAILALTKHLRAGEPDDFKSVHVSWPGKDVGVEFPTPGSVSRALNDALKKK